MAGEIEDYITLQAESLPSGSVSFGRFELEQLSWERRSSFSHNRYLEEVEKYSKPGSVTKKKEYFEAQFKKKALLHRSSLENRNELETRLLESMTVDNSHAMEEFAHNSIGQVKSFLDDENTPAISDEQDTLKHCNEKISSAESPAEFSSFDAEAVNMPFCTDGMDNGVHFDRGDLPCLVEEQTPNDNVNGKELTQCGDALSKISKAEKKNEAIKKKTQITKTSEAVEKKAGKSKLCENLPNQQMSKRTSSIKNSISSGKMLTKEGHRENASRVKLEKQTPSKNTSLSAMENKNLNLKSSGDKKPKDIPESKSVEILRSKKAGVAHPPIFEKLATNVAQPLNSAKLVSSAEIKQTSIFHFRSGERAKKRKEFNMKLEEKLLAKEAEMSEIQARTEEVKQAELKQLRRSLNFKATPMPNFYHESASSASESKKMQTVTLPVKSQHSRKKPSSPSGNHSSHGKSLLSSLKPNQENSSSVHQPQSSTQSQPSIS
ncbi:Protein WVD2-like 1 [Apostasia shenzhenica]|uniref:Protein WVD2-like 1 n=1 Tax=Apostasia shenzhenica TaxID=1088818 RepID=A0A2I0A161_9ASPA|nr:Protein WVD2-like 1 [Apostasia shenzhenica]